MLCNDPAGIEIDLPQAASSVDNDPLLAGDSAGARAPIVSPVSPMLCDDSAGIEIDLPQAASSVDNDLLLAGDSAGARAPIVSPVPVDRPSIPRPSLPPSPVAFPVPTTIEYEAFDGPSIPREDACASPAPVLRPLPEPVFYGASIGDFDGASIGDFDSVFGPSSPRGSEDACEPLLYGVSIGDFDSVFGASSPRGSEDARASPAPVLERSISRSPTPVLAPRPEAAAPSKPKVAAVPNLERKGPGVPLSAEQWEKLDGSRRWSIFLEHVRCVREFGNDRANAFASKEWNGAQTLQEKYTLYREWVARRTGSGILRFCVARDDRPAAAEAACKAHDGEPAAPPHEENPTAPPRGPEPENGVTRLWGQHAGLLERLESPVRAEETALAAASVVLADSLVSLDDVVANWRITAKNHEKAPTNLTWKKLHEDVRDFTASYNSALDPLESLDWMDRAQVFLLALSAQADSLKQKVRTRASKNKSRAAAAKKEGAEAEENEVRVSGNLRRISGSTWPLSMQRVRASVGEKVRLFNPLRNDEVVSLLDSVRLAGSLQVRLAHPKLGRVEQEVLASVLAAIAPVIVVKRPEGVWLNDVEQLDVCHNSSPEEEVLAEDVGEDQVSALVDASVRKKPQGRPTVVSSDVLRIIQELLDADAQQAHVRRREDVATVGVTVRQMLKRLAECNLKVSESTVRRLFVAPHAGHLSSRSYSSLFRVRMTSYQDTSHEEHPAQHHSRAQVRLVMEAAVKFAEEVAAFSCDAKAVVPVGALAVSKFVQPKKYMLAPHTVSDHQFAVKSHVKPVVLLHLDLEREKRKGLVRGRDNRERYGYPRTGSLTVYLRACMFVQNNAHTNVQHLVDTYEALPAAGQKPVLFVISDNATDYNPSSITVELCLWRAMKKLKLDMLLACSYAPYDSASNPVERAMACLSFSLAGRTFGHDPPPRKDEENHAMHNSALSAMAQALSGTRDQYPITAHPVSLQNGSDDTWDSIKAVAHGSRKATNGNPALLTVLGEFQEMRTHLDRRNNLCAFKRCTSLKCAHCTKLPKVRAEGLFNALASLKECGAHFFTPTPVGTPVRTQQHPAPGTEEDDKSEVKEKEEEEDNELGLSQAVLTQLAGDQEAGEELAKEEEGTKYETLAELMDRRGVHFLPDSFRPASKKATSRCNYCGLLCTSPGDEKNHWRLFHPTAKGAPRDPHPADAETGVTPTTRLTLLTRKQLQQVAESARVRLQGNKADMVKTLCRHFKSVESALVELESKPGSKLEKEIKKAEKTLKAKKGLGKKAPRSPLKSPPRKGRSATHPPGKEVPSSAKKSAPQPMQRDLALIAKNKLEDMGLSLVTVPGDGNCQFHALGLVLGAQAAAVRSSVVAFAAANPTLLRELVQARDPQAWMNGMATHDWGDIVSLTLATKMHPSLSSLVLFVLSGVSQFVMPVGEEPNENSVMLVYYYHEQNAHYDFVCGEYQPQFLQQWDAQVRSQQEQRLLQEQEWERLIGTAPSSQSSR
ncbi:hypothetical protein DIPPA_07816 [Diplonema papillatum]|nr:hypothetical protein DIPPA_20694 [Diplonema papillatum]KAJ9440296.1 hypothetical protein DIPPA_13049 [Diplonema papillatum]KAJ9448503.1 hypothetical protein DIPPA_31519 [Diplonema papillatum]KAJ9449256.1 hypothetical protein DIPPA_20939 [Diplonema papillatum]KAJ9462200.1 hypothetical protein DIPPA_07816 [Diplonema papillatum]